MAMEKFRHSPLPRPRAEYSEEQMFQLVRVLELYFNQLDSQTPLQAEYFRGRGDKLTFPHIAASDSTDQIAGGNDTPTVVKWSTLDSGSGWTLNSPGSAIALYAGVYTIRYSLQFINTANAIHYADVWLKVNNADVANSTSRFTLPGRKSATEFTYNLGYSEVTFSVNVGDEIELYWATDLAGDPDPLGPVDGVYMFHDAAQTTPYARPAIPSAIGSITFVSATSDPVLP